MQQIEQKLDLKDKKLLFHLDFNARAPYSQLAKATGLSKQGVEYKINNLVKKGIIKGFYPVINVPKFGYLYCRLSITLQNVDEKTAKDIENYLINNPKFFWVFTTQGIFDFLVVTWATSISDFKHTIEELLSEYGKYIKTKNESITTDVIHFQHRFLLSKKETKIINIKESPEQISIDQTDREILKLLCEDARMKLVTIAQKLNVSAKVAAYRIKQLEKKKVIEGYRPIIDHNKLGYTYYKLWINIHYQNADEINKFYTYVQQNPIVLYIVKGIGLPEDLDIEVMVKNNLELFDFIKDLKIKFPNLVGDYRSFMFIDTKKVRYLPF